MIFSRSTEPTTKMLARRVSADERQLAYFFASYPASRPTPRVQRARVLCARVRVRGGHRVSIRGLGFATSRRFARRRWLMVPFGRGIRTSHTSPALSSLLTCWRRRVATSRASPPSPARPPNRLIVGHHSRPRIVLKPPGTRMRSFHSYSPKLASHTRICRIK